MYEGLASSRGRPATGGCRNAPDVIYVLENRYEASPSPAPRQLPFYFLVSCATRNQAATLLAGSTWPAHSRVCALFLCRQRALCVRVGECPLLTTTKFGKMMAMLATSVAPEVLSPRGSNSSTRCCLWLARYTAFLLAGTLALLFAKALNNLVLASGAFKTSSFVGTRRLVA